MAPPVAKTALVLSGGGFFGAYQAGVWSVLADLVQPDLVIGASIGSLNGWAIASGAPPETILADWRDPARSAPHVYRWPRSITDGIIDATRLEGWIEALYTRCSPRIPFAVALTRMPSLRLETVEHPHVTWRHLAASCAVPLLLPMQQIDGALYADGGLVVALPMWAARRVGATRVISINLLANQSPLTRYRWGRRMRDALTAFNRPSRECEVIDISPAPRLGGYGEMMDWRKEKIEQWIERGRRDALAKKHLL